MSYEDKTLQCVECGTSFTFSAAEQEFFAAKGLAISGMCHPCGV